MRHKKNKIEQKKIGRERIHILFKEAKSSFKDNPDRSDRYIHLARKIGMKLNIRLPRSLQLKFCKHCYKFLQPGINSTQRTKEGKLIIYCKTCKKYNRIPLSKKARKE